MKNSRPQKTIHPRQIMRRLFLSAFVVGSFILYAIHKPLADSNGGVAAASTGTDTLASQPASGASATASIPATPDAQSAAPQTGLQEQQQQQPPTDTAPAPTPTAPATQPPAVASGAYRDGTYTGPQVDAYYGLVQVQATIQNGKIANVQFLEYPNDRRTSVRINDIAIPYLQQEAIQAQNANVDIISGATLTSQAFADSLQSALDKAKG